MVPKVSVIIPAYNTMAYLAGVARECAQPNIYRF